MECDFDKEIFKVSGVQIRIRFIILKKKKKKKKCQKLSAILRRLSFFFKDASCFISFYLVLYIFIYLFTYYLFIYLFIYLFVFTEKTSLLLQY